MKTAILSAALLVAACSTLQAGELTIVLSADRQEAARIQLSVTADAATAVVGGETERFDLKQMRWLDGRTNQWVTLEECEKWGEQSRTTTQGSLDSAPAPIRAFVQWMLAPTFKKEQAGDVLRLTSGQVDYVIEGKASEVDVEAYYRYSVLNAYKKAVTEKKLPPFAELKAVEEMKSLGYIPRKMSIAIPGVPGAPNFTLEISESK